MNLALLAQRTARTLGERPALARGTVVLHDHAALGVRIARLAGALQTRLSLARGARVALIMANNEHYVELLFACWHAGLIAVPVNAKLHHDEFAYVFEHSGASVCFTDTGHAPALPAAPDLREVIVVGSPEYATLLESSPVSPVTVRESETAWLFYTSGTTGKPKGAMLTHANLMAMTQCYFCDVDTVTPLDAILHAAPMSHGSGLYILPHVAQGACQIVPESGGFEPDEVATLLAAYRGVSLFAAPTMVKRLLGAVPAHAASNIRTLVYGGGPMYREDLHAAQAALGPCLVQIYGQGESPMTITALSKYHHRNREHARYLERLGSVGVAQALVEVRVAGDDDGALGPGETGEVLVRGPSVFAGYWDNDEATREALRNDWLHTGDLGRLDEDGFLTLVDRARDLVISGGANIYPREVEEVLLQHPRVMEVAVVGAPDPEWGEQVVAFVVADDVVSAAELDAHCLARLARFKRPRDYRFVDALPKNNYGKVLKRELRALLAGAGAT